MYWEEPDETNTDNNTNYYDTPKYAVDVLEEPCHRLTDVVPRAEITETL